MPDPVVAFESSLQQGVTITGTNPVVAAVSLSVTNLNIDEDSEICEVYSSGKHNAQAIWPGKVRFTGSFDVVLDSTTAAALVMVNPVAPTTPPPAKIYPIFSLNDGKWLYAGCKCTGAKGGVTLNKECKVTFSFTAVSRTTGSAVTIPELDDPFIGYDITMTGFAVKDTESVDFDITNGVKEQHGMSGADRTPDGVVDGYQKITANLKFNENHLVDVAAAALAVIASGTIVLNSASGTVTYTITFTNLLPGKGNRGASEEDIVKYGLDYGATAISFTQPV